jgi:hypothetical protein
VLEVAGSDGYRMIGNRLLSVSAIVEPTGPVTGFDMSGLVRRLLLFDKYIVVSVRLLEFRHLPQHLRRWIVPRCRPIGALPNAVIRLKGVVREKRG